MPCSSGRPVFINVNLVGPGSGSYFSDLGLILLYSIESGLTVELCFWTRFSYGSCRSEPIFFLNIMFLDCGRPLLNCVSFEVRCMLHTSYDDFLSLERDISWLTFLPFYPTRCHTYMFLISASPFLYYLGSTVQTISRRRYPTVQHHSCCTPY